MVQVIWTDPALEELRHITDFIALDNPIAAKKLAFDVFRATEQLSRFPLLGSRLSESPRSGHRQLVVRPCRIFYRPVVSQVLIIYVMRGERQFRPEFLKPTER